MLKVHWPSALNTNRWKPGIKMLKVHATKKNWQPGPLPLTAWPSALNTNRCKPGIEMLKVHTMEKNRPSSRIKPRTTGSLGRWCGCWSYTQSSCFTVLPCLYEWIALCAGEGLSTPMYPSLPSLAFCPKHKPLEARHGNAESPLWRKTVPHQGSNPGPRALWVGAGPTAPRAIAPLLLALYSILLLYCLTLLVWVYCIVCWGRVNDPHVPGTYTKNCASVK